jgi:outer membrane protein assembly factor BamB
LICLVGFWLLTFLLARFNKPYFVGFMAGLALSALVTIFFLGWWFFSRGLRRWEKLAGFALILSEAILVGMFTHHTVGGFTLWTIGLPLVGTLIVGWILLARKLGIPNPRFGFFGVVTLGWAFFLLIRVDGADASLHMQTHLRWTPTAEERFLARSSSEPVAKAKTSDLSVPSTSLTDNDWMAFRGPNRDGVITGTSLTTNWTKSPPTLIWKHSVGPAWSSLLVVGQRVFTQEQRGDKEMVVCYDAASGASVWVHEDVARFDETVSGPGPRATPTFSNGRLYTLGGTGLLNCLDAGTGELKWRQDIKEASGAKVPMWAFSSSPLVTEDLVIVYAGGEAGKGLLAYHSQSGQLAWSGPAGASSYSSAQITVLVGTPQCLMLHDAGLTAFDVKTGAKLWETGVAMKGAPRCSQPRLISTNQLFVASLGGLGSSLIEVSTNGGGWAAVNKWDSKDLKPEFPDFVVYNGYAYGFDIGVFCCLDLTTGKRAWKEGRYGRGEVMLLRDQGLLLISSETGELVLLAADPTAHRELGRFQALEGKTWNHPVVRGGRVYLRNAQEMACYAAGAAQQLKISSR